MQSSPPAAYDPIFPALGAEMTVDQRPLRLLRVLLDLLAVLLAFWTSFLLHSVLENQGVLERKNLDPADYINLAFIFGLICIAVFSRFDLYRERASVLNLSELQAAIKGVLLSAAIFLAIMFLARLPNFSRFVTFAGFFTSAVFVVLERRLFSAFVRKVQLEGKIARRNVLIYGCGHTGKLLMKKLIQAPHKACRVVGFLDDFAPRGSRISCRIHQTTMEVFEARVLGRLQDLGALSRELRIDELLVTVSLTNAERHHELMQLAREANVIVGVIPRFGEVRADQLEVEDLSAITVLRPSSVRPRRLFTIVKRCFDLITATVLLIVTTPLWLLASALILLESGRPVLFRQLRVGKDGERFRILKFRTMRQDVDPYENSPQGDDGDPRITRIGKILRMAGFDELPQIINVLRGEMSLVGPRPEMPFIAEKYSALESQRLAVKPGITGIWQLSCDRHAEIHENLEYDLYYIRHQSVLLDFLILLETVFFTIGLASNIARRESARRQTHDIAVPLPDRFGEAEPSDGYILVALDQRRSDTLPESWVTCGSAFYVLASHSHLKILVAPDNVAALDSLVEKPGSVPGRAVERTEYVPYVDRSQLRALTNGAKMVVTDLDHVEGWARDANVDILFVDASRIRWYNRSQGHEALVADLAERVSIEMPDEGLSRAQAADTEERAYPMPVGSVGLAFQPPESS